MSGRKKKKNPSELNKTVWLKFKQGWSLFLTQWLSAYAGPRSLCPRPQSLWRARSFYIFSESEENKLLTHSCSTAERRGSHRGWLHLRIQVLSTWKPRLSFSLSDSLAAHCLFFSSSCISVPEASVTFRTQQKVKQVCVSGWAAVHLSGNFFFFFFICFVPINKNPWVNSDSTLTVSCKAETVFLQHTGGGVCDRRVCVCVYSICARADSCERARVLCQFQRKETPKWIGSLLITRQR